MSDFAENLRTALDRSGMTQRQLADRLGVTEVTISRYVRGDRRPRCNILYDISKALGVPVVFLLKGEEEPQNMWK